MSHPLIGTVLNEARVRLCRFMQGELFVESTLEPFAARPEIAGHEALAADWISLATTWAAEGMQLRDYTVVGALHEYLTRNIAIFDLQACAHAAGEQ